LFAPTPCGPAAESHKELCSFFYKNLFPLAASFPSSCLSLSLALALPLSFTPLRPELLVLNGLSHEASRQKVSLSLPSSLATCFSFLILTHFSVGLVRFCLPLGLSSRRALVPTHQDQRHRGKGGRNELGGFKQRGVASDPKKRSFRRSFGRSFFGRQSLTYLFSTRPMSWVER